MTDRLKTTGWTLIGIAILLMFCTASGMISLFHSASTEDGPATELAQGMERWLGPMTVGGPVLIAGLILVVVGWCRGRRTRRMAM